MSGHLIINVNYMDYTICDICQETIKTHGEKTYIVLGGEYQGYSLCGQCSEPVRRFILGTIIEPNLAKQRLEQQNN